LFLLLKAREIQHALFDVLSQEIKYTVSHEEKFHFSEVESSVKPGVREFRLVYQ
jgi:hypothetical protein